MHAPDSTEATTAEHSTGELIRFVAIALVVALFIRFFIAQPFIVSGASMDDTIHHNEYLIVDQVTYHFSEPERGDVVVFRYPGEHGKYLIKRVIGLPGDTVEIDGTTVTITRGDETIELTEPYLRTQTSRQLTTVLAGNEYFVMGDNRGESSDSRTWGAITREDIVGRVALRLFPLSRIDILPGAYTFDNGSASAR